MPVMIDGGVGRGTNILKALALGATAVGIGRPYVWGLASFGQAGVEKVLDILGRELTAIMQQVGTVSLANFPKMDRRSAVALTVGMASMSSYILFLLAAALAPRFSSAGFLRTGRIR